MVLKTCTKCEMEKPLEAFPPRPQNKDGRTTPCHACRKEYYYLNRERLLEQKKEYTRREAVQIKAAKRASYLKKADEVKRKRNAYHAANRVRINEKRKADYAANHEERLQESREYYTSNQQRIRARENIRRRNDPKVRLTNNMRAGVWRLLAPNAKRGRTYQVLGYTAEVLRAHLERQFQTGMTWENYGEWHVDHRIPLSVFNYETTDDLDFKRAWSLENLQPLWGTDNHKKRSKLSAPFQPSLLLAEAA